MEEISANSGKPVSATRLKQLFTSADLNATASSTSTNSVICRRRRPTGGASAPAAPHRQTRWRIRSSATTLLGRPSLWGTPPGSMTSTPRTWHDTLDSPHSTMSVTSTCSASTDGTGTMTAYSRGGASSDGDNSSPHAYHHVAVAGLQGGGGGALSDAFRQYMSPQSPVPSSGSPGSADQRCCTRKGAPARPRRAVCGRSHPLTQLHTACGRQCLPATESRILPAAAGSSDEPAWARLVPEGGGASNPTAPLTLRGTAHVLGRSKSCRSVVSHSRVSAQHCVFYRAADGAALLEDLSRYGTIVSVHLIGKGGSAPLADGDVVTLLAPSGRRRSPFGSRCSREYSCSPARGAGVGLASPTPAYCGSTCGLQLGGEATGRRRPPPPNSQCRGEATRGPGRRCVGRRRSRLAARQASAPRPARRIPGPAPLPPRGAASPGAPGGAPPQHPPAFHHPPSAAGGTVAWRLGVIGAGVEPRRRRSAATRRSSIRRAECRPPATAVVRAPGLGGAGRAAARRAGLWRLRALLGPPPPGPPPPGTPFCGPSG